LPGDFAWGAATSAFQIEGAWDADGKGPSVWDALAHAGRLAGGATGDVACDHYHRLDEDLDLIAGLGLTAYRFSVSWPRVQPDGRRLNPAGLDFYERLVDGLLERGVAPALTLYHWDHPLALEERGGWTSPAMADWFADYAELVGCRLGDRVAHWMTLNEPLSVMTGHALGFSRAAGGLGLEGGLRVAHHQLLAHGKALQRLRALDLVGDLGIAVNVAGMTPADDSPECVAATQRAEVLEDRLFLDPLLLGRYPLLEGVPVVDCSDADLALISAPLDFLGINWYCPGRITTPRPSASPPPQVLTLDDLLAAAPGVFGYARADLAGAERNVMGWPVAPQAFGDVLSWLRTAYPALPPLHITENGLPAPDVPGVADEDRIAYLSGCLEQIAAADGLDIRGYYVWSLLDNLEWGLGYGPRFGLVHVDFETLARTPKASYHWYRELIATHMTGATRDLEPA
jgi:beta-glucosidase